MSTHLSNVWFKVTELDVVSGSGCTVTTADGAEYLDFTSGIAVTSTGHCHPKVVAAIREQAGKFIHAQVNVYRHPLLEQLATRLAGVTPERIDTFFFANSGAEATEAAVKLARQATHRPNVIVMDGSFHGRTMMAMAMTTSKTGYRAGYQPLPAGVFVTPFPRAYEWKVDEDTAVRRALDGLERLLLAQTAPNETAAIVIEPVLGEGGYIPAPSAYLQGVREICDATGIQFVADEVQSGFARTGRMFAVEHAQVVPDIIVMAKGIASGFPIAGIGASAELMGQWPQGAHGGTYGGNPIGCAAALATIDVIESEHLADNARDQGRRLVDALAKLQADDPGIGDVRGLGLMIGTEMVDADGAPAAARTAAILRHCLDESNVIFMNCGTGGNVLRWMPPLIVSAGEIDRGVAAFAAALKATA
ncbi:MAG: 4-aminobutyrate aminotransferase [Actinomycetota bacterium]|jgi:4-aminobutyrate aminotransferase|nr:4-aminobutyrate aminotransferase [Actinomycetota bacterium]